MINNIYTYNDRSYSVMFKTNQKNQYMTVEHKNGFNLNFHGPEGFVQYFLNEISFT